jgi:site-specific recombinase XerD
MAIPFKRHERHDVRYLQIDEIKALLAAPDRTTWLGRRDHAMLLTAVLTGVRVTELVTLRIQDISLSTGAHAHVIGKGRLCRMRHRPPYVAPGTMLRAAEAVRGLALDGGYGVAGRLAR